MGELEEGRREVVTSMIESRGIKSLIISQRGLKRAEPGYVLTK